VHYPLLVFFKAALHLPRASIGELSVLTGVAVLLAVVLYAQVVYELFEKNTDRLRNWIKPLVLGRSAG
jgi:peptidoglycan/LPS O-acetylase OafA/YrhL